MGVVWDWGNHNFSHLVQLRLPCPNAVEARVLFETFRSEVATFETELTKARTATAKSRRIADANLVFQDCKRDRPPQVDSLALSTLAEIEEVQSL